MQQQYETARFTAFWLVKTSMAKTDNIKKPIDLVRFSWEKEHEKQHVTGSTSARMSKEEKEEIAKKLGYGI